jgi:hypothetical protein
MSNGGRVSLVGGSQEMAERIRSWSANLADSTVACYDTLERLDTCLLSHCCGLRRIKEQRRLGFFCGWEMELEMGIGREVRM